MPTTIDLFAGCGGMSSGFAREGFETRHAVEWDVHAAATFAENFVEATVHCGDIADWTEGIPEVDVVVGGPPCQGFSNLGNRDPGDPRNQLWREYVRVVSAARPKVFVIENVDRFRSSPEFELLVKETETGALRDYDIVHQVLNAADYGVPQRRRRTIVIGSRIGTPRLPGATHSKDGSDGRAPWRTVRDAIDDIDRWPPGVDLPKRKHTAFGYEVPGVFEAKELHLGRRPREISRLRYECIPPGGGRFDLPDELLPDCWRRKKTGTTDVMGRMRWDEPSLTIRTEFYKPEKGRYLHPEWTEEDASGAVNRPITHREAARLQTFEDDFLWCGSKIEIAKQIGNAVPVDLAAVIARTVNELLSDS